MTARIVAAAIGLFLVAVVTACEPSITAQGDFEVTITFPYCPTTDSAYFAADSVPLGCPTPAAGLGLRVSPVLVSGDGSWLFAAQRQE